MNHSSRSRVIAGPGAGEASGTSGRARKAWPLLAVVLAALTLGGCGAGAKYTMHLDAYAEHVPYGKRFVVLQGVMDAKPGDEQFKASAEALARAVEAKGFIRAPSVDQADLALYLAYHVTEHSRAPFDTFQQRQGFPLRPPRLIMPDYTRDIQVEAVDMARFKAGDPKNVVWKIHVVSKGPISDMGKTMPYVAAAVAQYMDTSGEVFVEVDDAMNVKPFKPEKHHQRP